MTDGDEPAWRDLDSQPAWDGLDGDADRASEYLDSVSALDAIEDYKRRSHRLLYPAQGDRLLDVGCGTGEDVCMLADHVDPDGAVVGIDADAALVERARRRAAEPTPASFQVGNALALPLADDSMDCSRADRLFQHLEDPRAALGELCRVTRAGGRVAVTDTDWETLVLDAPGLDEDVTDAVTDSRCNPTTHPRMGRRLYGLARTAGLSDVAVDPATLTFTDFETADRVLRLDDRLSLLEGDGLVTPAEADRWLRDVHEADREGTLFCSISLFTVAGTVTG